VIARTCSGGRRVTVLAALAAVQATLAGLPSPYHTGSGCWYGFITIGTLSKS